MSHIPPFCQIMGVALLYSCKPAFSQDRNAGQVPSKRQTPSSYTCIVVHLWDMVITFLEKWKKYCLRPDTTVPPSSARAMAARTDGLHNSPFPSATTTTLYSPPYLLCNPLFFFPLSLSPASAPTISHFHNFGGPEFRVETRVG